MSKKVNVLVSVLVAVVLLTMGATATVLAQNDSATPIPEPSKTTLSVTDSTTIPEPATKAFMATANITGLLPRVAVILGIPESTLVAAFKQAERQIKDEAFLKALEEAVASGRLTQEEANKLKEWWQQRPDGANLGIAPFARIFARHGGAPLLPPGGDNTTASGNITGLLPRVAAILGIPVEKLESAIKQAQQERQAEAFLKMLDKAVAKGIITQAEADQIKTWWQQRPEAVNRLLPQILKGRPNPRVPRGMGARMMRPFNMPRSMMPGFNIP